MKELFFDPMPVIMAGKPKMNFIKRIALWFKPVRFAIDDEIEISYKSFMGRVYIIGQRIIGK